MYKVVKFFTDLQDNGYQYKVGDTFPREGLKVTDARLAKLAGKSNRQGVPLIEEISKVEDKKDISLATPKSLNAVTPVQFSQSEQGASPKDKPKSGRKKKKDDGV